MWRIWLILVLVLAPGALAAPPRPPEEPTRKTPRDPEPSPPAPRLDEEEVPLFLDQLDRTGGCHVRGYARLASRLRALDNDSQYMSLEVWGDAEEYGPFQQVLFHLRVPRGAYVTLYWLGPDGHITVPLDNVRVPPERNVTIDTGGIIVPPFGKEQWVAVATLEPFPLDCTSEAAMLSALERRLKVLHGVGHWEVRSLAAPSSAPSDRAPL